MFDRLLKLLISILFFIFYKLIVLIVTLSKKNSAGSLIILTYHSVKPEQVGIFEKQMDMLIKVAYPVSADVKKPLKYGQDHVAVTFDDGFQSVFENAIPFLLKKGIPATIFVPSGYIGKKPGWIKHGFNNSDEIVMTNNQLKNLDSDLIRIGAHCVTHSRLSKLEESEMKREISESKRALEKLLNKDVDLLSFPFGDNNQQVLQYAREVGYKRVFSNVPTFPSSKIDSCLIGRTSVSLEDWRIEYRLKLLGAYQWLPVAISLKSKFISLFRGILNYIRSN